MPAGQSVHSVFEVALARGGKLGGTGAHMVAYLPFSHGKQLPGPAAPSTGLYVPMGHRVHTEARVPVRSPYCPFRNWYTGRARYRRNLGGKRAAQDAILVLGALGVEAHAVGQGALRDARVGIRVVA